MQKILYYFLNFRPNGNGRIIFRLEGENQNLFVDLTPNDFSAIAAVLAQKKIAYDKNTRTFTSYDDDYLPLKEKNDIT
ncbi:MAG: hypothetical protein M0R37_06925 [Bacteroidales bacterium]|jgi:hypothetical protein|nr:hypothetical protein [Bacteroidales bacterium]